MIGSFRLTQIGEFQPTRIGAFRPTQFGEFRPTRTAYVFMKHGASAGSKWAKAKERADAVVIPCRAEETVRQHFMAAVKQMNKRKQRETTESLK